MKRIYFFILLSILVLEPVAITKAQDDFLVNPHYLVSDHEMLDIYSMSLVDIEHFLLRGGLSDYQTVDVHGNVKSAAEIIYDAAIEFEISPRFLLVLLQREQSLVEDDSPSQDQLDWAMGYAVCDDCSKSDPRIAKFKGFGNQVYYAAKRIRESYLYDLDRRGYTETGLGPGIEKIIDGSTVIPVNNATAALYTYTPHLHGNENFAKIWNRWFSYEYVAGSLLQNKEDGGIWLIQAGQRRPITSRTAFYSRFNADTLIQVGSSTLEQYPIGAPIHFPNYSLLRSPSGTVYLLVDDTRRGFVSQEAFRSLGFVPDEIVDVTWEDLAPYVEGEPLTVSASYPQGALLQEASTGGVFYVENNEKHPIFSREILYNRFTDPSFKLVDSSELEAFVLGDPLLFHDGTLVAVPGSPDVFVISEGKRRPIANELTFYQFGWNWDQIIWTSERAVLEHPLGEILDIQEYIDYSTDINLTSF